ncbi:MAG: hypothetical protein ACXU82_16400 [Caulobacteraceae bacterium]
MSITLHWVAVKGGNRQDILGTFGLEDIGETTEEIDQVAVYGESPEGWSILAMKSAPRNMDGVMASITASGQGLYGFMSDIVMFSEVRSYTDGLKTWAVVHDPTKGKGSSTIVQGEPPAQFEDIKRELDAQQAEPGNEQVDYLFDLPRELSASICGYRPSEGGLAWSLLGRKKKGKSVPVAPDRSLTAAMKAELLPLLWSLGWKPSNDDPKLYLEDEIIREIGAKSQTIRFRYCSWPAPYIDVLYRTTEEPDSGPGRQEAGMIWRPMPSMPRRRKFTWLFFGAASAARRRPEDPFEEAIELAKTDIRAIHDYLTTGTRDPKIAILGRWTTEKPAGA